MDLILKFTSPPVLIALLMLSFFSEAQECNFFTISVIMFSGIENPVAEISSAKELEEIKNEIKKLPSIEIDSPIDIYHFNKSGYAGLLLHEDSACQILKGKFEIDYYRIIIFDGYICTSDEKFCYADADRRFEKLLLSIALPKPDIKRLSTSTKVNDLACLRPIDILPENACPTSLSPYTRQSRNWYRLDFFKNVIMNNGFDARGRNFVFE